MGSFLGGSLASSAARGDFALSANACTPSGERATVLATLERDPIWLNRD